MQDDSPQDWQKPAEAASGAPFQASAPEPELELNTADTDTEPLQPAPTDAETVDSPVASADDDLAEGTESNTPTFSGDTDTVPTTEPDDSEILVRWQGPEHLYSERSMMWYAALALATLIMMAIAYFAFNSLTFTILLPVMAVALGVYAHRPPEIIDYTLTRKGLYVRDRLMLYDQFKSFDVVTINNVHHIALIPRKRFQLGQNIYFPEESGEKIVDMLAARLPMKEVKPDFIDRILAKLHL